VLNEFTVQFYISGFLCCKCYHQFFSAPKEVSVSVQIAICASSFCRSYINAEYYLSLLVQLKDILKEKRRVKLTKGVLFLHDNVPAHWALATQKKLAYVGYQCLDYPPYALDLTPSDYRLFLAQCPGSLGTCNPEETGLRGLPVS